MIIQSKRVWYKEEFIEAQIEIENHLISNIYPYNTKEVDIDYGNNRIVPAFYDIHTHGYGGYDTCDDNKDGLKKWLKDITKEGVAGICPTTVTESKEVLSSALKNIADVKKENPIGAKILGVHFEGPYLNKEYKGGQNEKYIREADIEEMKEFIEDSDHLIKIITLAPEIENNFNIIPYLNDQDINVSIGHTAATFDIAKKAIENGAKAFTHTFNAMRPFKHREVGTVGASLLLDAYSEIICDALHVDKNALAIFFKIKPIDKIIMISDSLAAKGLPVGTKLLFGGQEVYISQEGICKLSKEDTIAGSTLSINKGLKLLVDIGIDFKDAIKTCTINPMTYLKFNDHKGLIEKGYDANITILDDDYNIINTYIEGKALDD